MIKVVKTEKVGEPVKKKPKVIIVKLSNSMATHVHHSEPTQCPC